MHSILVNNYIPELYYIKDWSLKHHKWPKNHTFNVSKLSELSKKLGV